MRALCLTTVSDVQRHCWPCVLAGHDTVGLAPTGSGKTLAYLLPLVRRLATLQPPLAATPLALVIVPTRELAQQITLVAASALASCTSCTGRVMAVHGGEARASQLAALASATAAAGPPLHLIVGTPGRLLDLAGAVSNAAAASSSSSVAASFSFTSPSPPLDLSSVRYVVLDEADKLLLSLELREQVAALVERAHPERQTLLFTATSPPGLPEAAAPLLRKPPARVVRVRSSAVVPYKRSTGGGAGGAGGAIASGVPTADEEDAVPPEGEEGEEGEDADAAGGLGNADDEADLLSVPRTIRQEVSVCAEHKKPRKLLKLMTKLGHVATASGGSSGKKQASSLSSAASDGNGNGARDERVLIFANKMKAVSFIATLLERHKVHCATLSSQLTAHVRASTLDAFRHGSLPVLVATDVAARGVHIEGLSHVVLWDFGTNLTQYVQRIGRTGRQGQAGTAHAFWTRNLRPLAPATVRLLTAHGQKVDPYLATLAVEVAADRAAGDGGVEASAEAVDDEHSDGDGEAATEKEDDGGGGGGGGDGRRPLAAAPPTSGLVGGDDSDSDEDLGSAQRWLAKKLISPITGVAPAFGAGALERKKKKNKRGSKGDVKEEAPRLKKKRERDVM